VGFELTTLVVIGTDCTYDHDHGDPNIVSPVLDVHLSTIIISINDKITKIFFIVLKNTFLKIGQILVL
jgi:hypothetical protein